MEMAAAANPLSQLIDLLRRARQVALWFADDGIKALPGVVRPEAISLIQREVVF